MLKTRKVVMLPTNKASQIILHNEKVLSYSNRKSRSPLGCSNQHLYVISDEEIKEGDWFITFEGIVYASREIYDDLFSILKDANNSHSSWKSKGKIIATTDKSLKVIEIINSNTLKGFEKKTLLPQISESFIQAYVKANSIDEVLVEYNRICKINLDNNNFMCTICDNSDEGRILDKCEHPLDTLRLRTWSDNTVIIHQAKTYSREDVVNLIESHRLWLSDEAGRDLGDIK